MTASWLYTAAGCFLCNGSLTRGWEILGSSSILEIKQVKKENWNIDGAEAI